jgi:chaperonin GroEL (HSP60 family)
MEIDIRNINSDAIKMFERKDIITVEDRESLSDELQVIKGITLNTEYISIYFINLKKVRMWISRCLCSIE